MQKKRQRLEVSFLKDRAVRDRALNFLMGKLLQSTYEDAASIFKLPLWKFKADEVDEAHLAFYTVLMR